MTKTLLKAQMGKQLPASTLKHRQNVYNTIRPSDYFDINNYARYIFNNKREEFDDERSEEAFRLYLGLEGKPKYFRPAAYRPTINRSKENDVYYSVDPQLEKEIFESYKDKVKPNQILKASELGVQSHFDESDPSVWEENGTLYKALVPGDKNMVFGRPMVSNARALGKFVVSRGKDEKGEYLSYADQYDFPDWIQKKMQGQPYKIYGRVYYPPAKKSGGPVVDPRGQWAHPGKHTIVPTPTGQITMQGVPYPVYGQDETGYGQMMMPGGEYTFPGQMVYEIPMMQKGGSYTGPSIVDYLATKGYSGGKKFRKELAEKYGVDNYDFSAAKNTELLNKLRENEELLQGYDQSMAPLTVAQLESMRSYNQGEQRVASTKQKRNYARDFILRNLAGQSVYNPRDLRLQTPAFRLRQGVEGSTSTSAAPRSGNTQSARPSYSSLPAVQPVNMFYRPTSLIAPVDAKPNTQSVVVPRPAAKLSEMSRTNSAKTAAQKLEQQSFLSRMYDEVSESFDEGVELVGGFFGGLQRKWESMQKEDSRSIARVNNSSLPVVQKPVVSNNKKQASLAPTVPFGYRQLYAVPDVKRPKDSLVAFVNTFDNEQGGRYYIGNKAKEVTDAGAPRVFQNSQAVAHFLRDADILPGQKITPSEWTVSKGYKYHTTSPGKTVSATGFNEPERFRMLYRPNPSGDGTYQVKYVRNREITPEKSKQLQKEGWGLDFTVSGQHRFADIDWDKDGSTTGYAAASRWLPLKDGKDTRIPYKSKDGFSRFSGGSGIYLFRDPRTGKQVGVDVSGSVNTLRKVGEDLVKTYGIKPEDLEFAYHDMGSYSAKPKAHGDVLDYNQWLDYNTYNRGFSGAPLVIPKKKKGGQHGGLDRWFAEKWVDVKTGKPCGRQEGENRAYPACRPSKRVSSETPKTSSEMSPAEKAKFKRSKTSSERINYNHKRK